MAETLGSLCDKLTIVKLKQYHSQDEKRLASLADQERQLIDEIDAFVGGALCGTISARRLTFAANKVYKVEGNSIAEFGGDIGELFSRLASVNCRLWHEQEKVYDFARVAAKEKDIVVKQLALLNLERNVCIDKIDHRFTAIITSRITEDSPTRSA